MVVNTKDVVIKGKSVVQKFVLEFGVHFLGSVLCKSKRCSVNTKDSVSVVVLRVRVHANLENIPKIR